MSRRAMVQHEYGELPALAGLRLRLPGLVVPLEPAILDSGSEFEVLVPHDLVARPADATLEVVHGYGGSRAGFKFGASIDHTELGLLAVEVVAVPMDAERRHVAIGWKFLAMFRVHLSPDDDGSWLETTGTHL